MSDVPQNIREIMEKPSDAWTDDDYRDMVRHLSDNEITWLLTDEPTAELIDPLIKHLLQQCQQLPFYNELYQQIKTIVEDLVDNTSVNMGGLDAFVCDYRDGFTRGYEFCLLSTLSTN